MIPPWLGPNAELIWRDLTTGQYDLSLLARWIAQSVSLSLLILLADLLLGAAILRTLRVRLPARLRGAAMIATGAGTSAILIFFLGVLGRIFFSWILGLTLLSALAGVWLLRSRHGRWFVFGWLPALRSRWMLLVLPMLLFHLFDLLMPVLEYDATMYHQAAARWYEETHSLDYHGGIRFNAQPHLAILLYLRHRILLSEDLLLKLLNLEFALALFLALAHFAHRRRISAAWPVLLLCCSPAFIWIASIEYADFVMTVWFAVAAVLLIEPLPAIALTAFILGCAAASKLQGLIMAAFLGLAFLLVRRQWKPVAALAVGVILCGIPWWTRSWLHTGSPMPPFFLSDDFEVRYLFLMSSRYGPGKDLFDFLKLPWNAMALSGPAFADMYNLGPPLALTLIIGFVALLRREGGLQPARGFSPAILLATFAFYLIFWFRTGQVLRYLAAMLPLLALLFSAAAASLKLSRWWLAPLAVLALVGSTVPSAVLRYRALPPVTFDNKERLLFESLRYYPATRELHRIANPGERTYTWFCEDAHYYVPTVFYGDWLGEFRYISIGNPGEDPATIVDRLRKAGFRYILVDRGRGESDATLYGKKFPSNGIITAGGPLPAKLEEIYWDGRYALLRID